MRQKAEASWPWTEMGGVALMRMQRMEIMKTSLGTELEKFIIRQEGSLPIFIAPLDRHSLEMAGTNHLSKSVAFTVPLFFFLFFFLNNRVWQSISFCLKN